MKNALGLLFTCLLLPWGTAWAQTRSQLMLPPMAVSPTSPWDTSLPGKSTYRSYANCADVIVSDDPEPAIRNLAAMFGQGSTVNNAAKALSVIFGEGIMTSDLPSGNTVTGTFDMGGGYVLDLKGTMQTSSWRHRCGAVRHRPSWYSNRELGIRLSSQHDAKVG